ncbi:helicase DnaB [Bifidobacterium breve MCC 0305]|nr:helicase DnaB [Bifidobacterium breve MCC 0305]KOA61500.1 helicase DnaB [Bifidobacterium breve MCC 1604]
MFAAICAAIAVQPNIGLLHGTCPNCGTADSLTVLYSPLESATLLRCSTCQADDVLNALNAPATLARSNGYEAMIYDSERGTAYEYADGLIVRRSPAKRISQSGNTADKHPLWMAADAKRAVALGKPVYLTEGEKDAGTLRALDYAAVTAAGGGGNFATKLDLDSARLALSGADVVAIVDKDDTGARWKEQVAQTLTPFVRSLTFIQAAGEAHDASDAAMSGVEFEILPRESIQHESELEPELMSRAYSLTRLADVEPERPLWLWPGHIPKGKIVLIDGDPATGKSTLALDIAAHVTTGAAWPDGSAGCEPANVLLLTAEDGLADTVSPRIRAAQGDTSKMFALSEVFKDGKEVAITLTDALPQIAQAVREQHIGLIVVDVLISFLGSDTNSYKDQDIRAQVMAPLKRLCEETGCTVIALRHLNKGQGAAIYRGGGSIGIIGAARAAFLVAKDPENEERRLFAPVKFNLGPMPRAMAYRLEDNPLLGCAHVHWLGETDDTAESHNQSAYGPSEREDSDVRTFIQDYFDHNKELTPDGLYWGVPSYRVINEAKGEFSKQ